ncbi:hypothetical protein FSARC_10705 [Fusarium sarcochroum]|uniref:Uncharacterized protein n=1 Tax=Fusarium sarcochroum TaxID=1208366 RepID=A0A8H4TK56_9HYPO|nr:hypothetical protein FSARC_10705 [Fusarium sarcochroum]
MPDLGVSEQVAAIVAEGKHLRQVCEKQKVEIENLRIQNEWLMHEVNILRDIRHSYELKFDDKNGEILGLNDELAKARREHKALNDKHESSQEQIVELEAKVSRRETQMNKLITSIYRKARTAHVCVIALKAAYKLVHKLEEKATLKHVLELAQKAPMDDAIDRDVAKELKRAGIGFAANDVDTTPQTSPLTLHETTTEDTEE